MPRLEDDTWSRPAWFCWPRPPRSAESVNCQAYQGAQSRPELSIAMPSLNHQSRLVSKINAHHCKPLSLEIVCYVIVVATVNWALNCYVMNVYHHFLTESPGSSLTLISTWRNGSQLQNKQQKILGLDLLTCNCIQSKFIEHPLGERHHRIKKEYGHSHLGVYSLSREPRPQDRCGHCWSEVWNRSRRQDHFQPPSVNRGSEVWHGIPGEGNWWAKMTKICLGIRFKLCVVLRPKAKPFQTKENGLRCHVAH